MPIFVPPKRWHNRVPSSWHRDAITAWIATKLSETIHTVTSNLKAWDWQRFLHLLGAFHPELRGDKLMSLQSQMPFLPPDLFHSHYTHRRINEAILHVNLSIPPQTNQSCIILQVIGSAVGTRSIRRSVRQSRARQVGTSAVGNV